MVSAVVLVVAAHFALASAEWSGTDGRRRTAMLLLTLASLLFALATVVGWRLASPWRLVRMLFEPVGALFLKVGG